MAVAKPARQFRHAMQISNNNLYHFKISLEMDCFYNLWTPKYLHSMTNCQAGFATDKWFDHMTRVQHEQCCMMHWFWWRSVQRVRSVSSCAPGCCYVCHWTIKRWNITWNASTMAVLCFYVLNTRFGISTFDDSWLATNSKTLVISSVNPTTKYVNIEIWRHLCMTAPFVKF